MREKHITGKSLNKGKQPKGKTDWARLDAMTDEQIEAAAMTDPDAPLTDAEFWANAALVLPGKKERLTIRLDSDIVDWFKIRGRGYQTRINAVLRAFVNAQRNAGR